MNIGKISFAERNGTYIIKLIGEIRLTLCATLDQFVETMFADSNFKAIVVDMSETIYVDSTSLGLLAKISIQSKQQFNLVTSIISPNEDMTRLLMSMGFDQIFVILREPIDTKESLKELPLLEATEEQAKVKVLEAHRVLMELNESNREVFKELVSTLEKDQPQPHKKSLF